MNLPDTFADRHVRGPFRGPDTFADLSRTDTFADRRQLTDTAGRTGAWTLLGTTSTSSFQDATGPAGTVEASYQVRGTRAGKDGAWSQPGGLLFVVNGTADEAELRTAT